MVTDWNCHPIRHRLCLQKPRPLKRREARRRRKEITTNLTSTSYVQINNITSGMQLVICTMIQWKILIAFFLNKGRGLPSTQPLVRSSSSAPQVIARPSGFSLKSSSYSQSLLLESPSPKNPPHPTSLGHYRAPDLAPYVIYMLDFLRFPKLPLVHDKGLFTCGIKVVIPFLISNENK